MTKLVTDLPTADPGAPVPETASTSVPAGAEPVVCLRWGNRFARFECAGEARGWIAPEVVRERR